ncbi:MAG: hypothetical protein WCA91_19050 [Candidatus Acidiferrales bacterium]
MKYVSKKISIVLVLFALLLVPLVSEAQLGSGIVYDPTNYHNALLRYYQLQEHLVQLQKTVSKVTSQLNLAMQMAQYIKNMPARYRGVFSEWRAFTSGDLYGNTARWVAAVNGAGPQSVSPAYQQAIIPFLAYNQLALTALNPADALQIKSAAASLQLMDGANVSALTTVGNIRANAQDVQQQIANLEHDSLSPDASLNTEVSVLNKINASNVLTLRTLQDANNLRVASLEQQVLQAKEQRDTDAANLNYAAQVRQQVTQNLASFNGNLSGSLNAYRLP